MIASCPVQPIASSASDAGSLRTTQLPMLVTRFATERQPVIQALVATTTASARMLPRAVRTRGAADAPAAPARAADAPARAADAPAPAARAPAGPARAEDVPAPAEDAPAPAAPAPDADPRLSAPP